MPRWTVSVPLSSSNTMNFPCRLTERTVWSRTRFASCAKFCFTTCFEKNCALRIRRPVRRGASVRTTVSTSGSSGRRHLDQNVVALDFDRDLDGPHEGVVEILARARIELIGMPGTH